MHFKKPNFWDEKLNLFSYLILPFTVFIRINNFLLNQRKKLISREIKTICVGNIYVGGTGKTPATIKIYNLIKKFRSVATAKKYYLAQKDEEILLRKKTKFLTSKNRVNIIKQAIQKKIEVIVFDDGLQDSQIDYNLKIVCFDAQLAVGNGFLIPAGPLRETLESLKKYDAVLIKCNDHNAKSLKTLIKKYNSKIVVFTSSYTVSNLSTIDKNKKYFIYSGIGNPKSFENILKKNKLQIVDKLVFPDHYTYSDKDYANIINKAQKYGASILTTEKDYVKIPGRYKKKIKFLKLNLVIHNEQKFIKFIKPKIT
jgi:tetraacyldisaccharide 4'-kinase